MSFRSHGYYCGPGWSDGKYQRSVANGKRKAMDALDESCRLHDRAYSRQAVKRLRTADFAFAKSNFGKGWWRTAHAIGVGAQAIFRPYDPPSGVNKFFSSKKMPAIRRTRTPSRGRNPAPYVTPRSNPRRGRTMARTPAVNRGRTLVRAATRSFGVQAGRATRSYGTQTGSRYRTRNAGGVSGGVATGRGSKVSKSLVKKMSGFKLTGEYGGIGTSANVGYIGHVSMPLDIVNRVMWGTVLKQLLEKGGSTFQSPIQALDDSSYGGLDVGDAIDVIYSPFVGAAVATETYSYSSADTLQDIIVWATDPARPFNSNNAAAGQPIFYSLLLQVDTGVAPRFIHGTSIRLDRLQISITSKSTLKMQNRTVVTAGDDEDDVNNQPLYGKGYFGKGLGTEWAGIASATFVASQVTGIFAGDDGSQPLLEDIPDPTTFKNVQRSAKLKLESGELKTSTINSHSSMSFNDLHSMMYPNGFGVAAVIKRKIGDYKLYIYEKMLDTGATYNIVFGFEHNLDMFGKCHIKQPRPTMLKFFEQTKNLTY